MGGLFKTVGTPGCCDTRLLECAMEGPLQDDTSESLGGSVALILFRGVGSSSGWPSMGLVRFFGDFLFFLVNRCDACAPEERQAGKVRVKEELEDVATSQELLGPGGYKEDDDANVSRKEGTEEESI